MPTVCDAWTWSDGPTTCRGLLARRSEEAPGPGVLLFPTWRGVDALAQAEAEALAAHGHVVLAVDVYGDGAVAASDEDAARRMQALAHDRALLRRRGQAALQALRAHPDVDPTRLAAVGFCFGGMGALELARAGADLQAVVTFHGFLSTPRPARAGEIRARLLVHHGSDDPLVAPAEVEAFRREMTEAAVDWTLVVHGGARHGFTNPAARSPARGVAHLPRADRRARAAALAFLEEAFAAAAAPASA